MLIEPLLVKVLSMIEKFLEKMVHYFVRYKFKITSYQKHSITTNFTLFTIE